MVNKSTCSLSMSVRVGGKASLKEGCIVPHLKDIGVDPSRNI